MNRTDEQIKELLKQVKENAAEMPTISSENIFSILNVSDKERFHSRFLHYIIGTFRDEFCEFCREHFDPKFPRIKASGSCCEYPCGKMSGCEKEIDGFIDIFFMTESRPIAIEVKWYAEDQPQQLLRYKECLKQRLLDPILIYLTISGKEASDNSTSCTYCASETCSKRRSKLEAKKDYFIMSFSDINTWLDKTLNKIQNTNAPIVQIIKQYKEILEAEMSEDKNVDIIVKGGENFFAAAEAVENVIDAVRAKISGKFVDALKNVFGKMEGYTVYEKSTNDSPHIAFDLDPSTLFVVQSDNNSRFFTIARSTNLYCYIGENDKLIEWSYITEEWFITNALVRKEQGVKYAINGKKPKSGQPIVKWFYQEKDQQEHDLDNIADYAIKYFES